MLLSDFCKSDSSDELLALSPQPISNRFTDDRAHAAERFPITLSQCRKSGLIYLSKPVPEEALVPPMEWLSYNEPEEHLDGMVQELLKVCGLKKGDIVGAVSSKDDTTLDRFAAHGMKTWRLSLEDDLGITRRGVGVESIQRSLSEETAIRAGASHGRADMLVVRHILEHVYDMPKFLAGLRAMTKPDGCIVLEVPDCSRALELCDYTTIWEEHLYYFTSATLRFMLELSGFSIEFFKVYPYPFEDSLVAVVRDRTGGGDIIAPPSGAELDAELQRGARFRERYPATRELCRAKIQSFASNGPIAVFGAGHLTTTFLSLFEVGSAFSFVIDDNPNKAGMYFPGTNLRVQPSSILSHEKISLCLLGVNPMSEKRIVSKLEPLIAESGGTIRSIFPSSPIYLGSQPGNGDGQ